MATTGSFSAPAWFWRTSSVILMIFTKTTLADKIAPKWINGPGHFTTSPQLAFAGESPVFHCFARGWPTPNISWWKNSSKIRNGDINGSLMLRNRKNGVDLSVLSVSRREHAGRYTCLAENSIGSATHHIQLHVDPVVRGGPPKVSAKTSNVTVKEGSNVNLTCLAENTPEIRTVLYWNFNGATVSRIEGHKELSYQYDTKGPTPKVTFSLELSNVTANETGVYFCGVTTTQGDDGTMVRLSLAEDRDVRDAGERKRLSYVVIAGYASLLIGLLITSITCRLRWKRKIRSLRRIEGNQYQYDLFVSFSGSDFHWVNDKLMPLLEKEQIKYCIHHRDFEVGKALIDNIADSVYNSKKVLAVLSENYLASRFCREELEIALYRCIQKGDSSLLLIKLDDISKKKLPKPVRRRTFLDYSNSRERKNWELRLLKQLGWRKDCSSGAADTRLDQMLLIAESRIDAPEFV